MNDLRASLAGPVESAARALLGVSLVSDVGGERVALVLTEVEAYGAVDDPASHAYRGRTNRNASMFGPPGTLYVYRSYGIHWCANVVCGPAGTASAALLRAGDVVGGVGAVRRRRGRDDHLTDGPGKLCQGLGITGDLDGISLFEGAVRLEVGERRLGPITALPRVGITRGTGVPWRFLLGPQPVDKSPGDTVDNSRA